MNRRYLLLPLLCGIAACADQPLTTGPAVPGPSFEIVDAARDPAMAHFYFLAPMVWDEPTPTGTFDAALLPQVLVVVCELGDSGCGSEVARFTADGPFLQRVTASQFVFRNHAFEQYLALWRTDGPSVSVDRTYRVTVVAAGLSLGYADVRLVRTKEQAASVDRTQYVLWVKGLPLPIRFRIETGIVGQVEVEPLEAEAEPGATRKFTPILRDLHGNLMTADVTWASSDETVATVDQTGLATAVAEGVATITATSERVTGSATLTVVDFGACSPFQAIAWYPLDNHGNDASGNGNHGTVQGASAAADRHGTESSALSFDGADDAIQLGDRFNTLALPFTVATWLYQPASARGQFRSILITDDQPGIYAGIWLQTDPSGLPQITYGSGGPANPAFRRTLTGNAAIPTDSWVHLAATVRGPTDMTLYVNGVAVSGTFSGSGGPLVHTPAPARIGVFSTNPANLPWLGQLDETRIYDCSLEAKGVGALLPQP